MLVQRLMRRETPAGERTKQCDYGLRIANFGGTGIDVNLT